MKKTQSQRLAEALLNRGSTEVPCRSRAYRQFTHPQREGEFYFVGRNAALRVGRNSSTSVSLERTGLRERLLSEVKE